MPKLRVKQQEVIIKIMFDIPVVLNIINKKIANLPGKLLKLKKNKIVFSSF